MWLLLASLFFYSWGEGKLVAVLIFSTVVDYFLGLMIAHNGIRKMWGGAVDTLETGRTRTTQQKIFLACSILVNLGVLAVFKYADFGLENYAAVADLFGWSQNVPLSLGIALPLGISFFTFQSMSYTIDVYRGATIATRNLLAFATFVTMFPQLVAGPIVRYVDVAKELVNRMTSRAQFASGIRRFIIGLAKKVLIANIISVPVDQIFALPAEALPTSVAWFGAIGYALQIYFDFSGYSDMAIGLGRMLGFTFLENFRFPYVARSLRDFWRRWHISLSTWFRDYVYISLGGNRRWSGRTYLNLLFVFFITGLWHGASWGFIVWGLFHGFFLSIERIRKGAWLERMPSVLKHMYVIFVVLLSWVLFRAETLGDALVYIQSMFGFGSAESAPLSVYLTNTVIVSFLIGCIAATPVSHFFRVLPLRVRELSSYTWRNRLTFLSLEFGEISYLAILFVLVILQLTSGTNNPFIYFRF